MEYSSPLLAYAGAVRAEPPDEGVAAHYGEPLREQRRLIDERSGFVDLSHRGVVRVEGPDRLTFLHALTTQALEDLAPGVGTTTLVLSPQGHVEHALYGVDDGEAFWAHVEPETAGELVEFLDSMRFLMRVEVAELSQAYGIVWEPTTDRPLEPDVRTRSAADSYGGRELFLPRERLQAYASTTGAGSPAGLQALEAIRIAAHRPRLGFETDHKSIPNELGWLDDAVHLEKGCYRGQETVARIHNLGKPPRRLVFLHLDGSVDRLPALGDPITADGREVGHVTSVARHVDLGPIGLGLVRTRTPVDAALLAGGVAAAQETIVDPEVGLHFKASLRH